MPSRSNRLLYGFFIACVALGVFFRLFHVDWKLYSYDETVTSLRASGHTFAEYDTFVHDGRTHAIGELEHFQAPARRMEERAVWNSLALEDPQHPPLYFWMTSLLQRVAGDSVWLRRLPAVAFGLLCLPAMWWFAYELFGDARAAWCTTALVAVSPFHVEYAQQAREYSFWTLTTALSSAFLLRALRGASGWNWAGYAVSVALGLWGFALFAQVAVAQALYVVAPLSGATTRRRAYALAALALGLVAFAPWLAVIFAGRGIALSDTSWSATHLSLPLYLGKWIFNAGSVFFDLDYVSIALVPLALASIALALWCCRVLIRTAQPRTWGFIALLGGVAAASWLGPDVLFHQSRAGESRYLTVLWISLELATGYGLAFGFPSGQKRHRFWRIATTAVLALGIASCAVSSFARTWWVASNEKTLPAIAVALASESGATLVSIDDTDILLEILPVSRADLRFSLHAKIDEAALRSAERPFVIAKPYEVQNSIVKAGMSVVALPALFPPERDWAIELLHRRATGDRFKSAIFQQDALYTTGTQRQEEHLR